MGVEFLDIVAKVSEYISIWNPVFTKIDRVVDRRTFEVSHTTEPIDREGFWKDCRYNNVSFSAEEKEVTFLRFHRAHNCFQNIQLLALALKRLCDMGLSIVHKGLQISDIVVLSDEELQVADLPGTHLTFKYTATAMALQGFSTYANNDEFQKQERSAGRGVSLVPQDISRKGSWLKEADLKKYTEIAPYWWIAVTAPQAVVLDNYSEKMVHVDICSAGFSEHGFSRVGGKLVPLQMFETPAFDYFPVRHLSGGYERFLIRPYSALTRAKQTRLISFDLPPGIPQLSSYVRMDGSHVKLSSLEKFIEMECSTAPLYKEWLRRIEHLHCEIMLRTPARTPVTINKSGNVYSCWKRSPKCEQKSTETNEPACAGLANMNLQVTNGSLLKQRNGRVDDSVTQNRPTDYIPVVLSGEANLVWVKPANVMLTQTEQYSTHAKLVQKYRNIRDPVRTRLSAKSTQMARTSAENHAALSDALKATPLMKETYMALLFGKVNLTFFEDANRVDILRTLLKPDFANRFLSKEDIELLKRYIEIGEYPHAIRRWNMLQRMVELQLQALKSSRPIVKFGKDAKEWMEKHGGAKKRRGRPMVSSKVTIRGRLKDYSKEGNTNPSPAKYRENSAALNELTTLANKAFDDEETVLFFKMLDDAGLASNPFRYRK